MRCRILLRWFGVSKIPVLWPDPDDRGGVETVLEADLKLSHKATLSKEVSKFTVYE
jgi:hypothetical protein